MDERLLLQGLIGHDSELVQLYQTNPFFRAAIQALVKGADVLVETLADGARKSQADLDVAVHHEQQTTRRVFVISEDGRAWG